VLIVSSFVEPRVGGVERFTRWLAESLSEAGCVVRTLAADLPGARADVVVPVWLVAESEWPLVLPSPTVLRAVAREIRTADLLLIQNFAHPLCLWAALAARRSGVEARTIVHTNGPPPYGSAAYRGAATAYDLTAARLTLGTARPIVLSESSADFVRRRFGHTPQRLRYPVGELPLATMQAPPGRGEPLRLVFAGRLAAEKDPCALVAAVDRLEEPAQLEVYGGGPLDAELRALARGRPWLRLHGPRSWDEVVRAQADAHAVVSASVRDNVQLALLEALAMGVPVVATRVGEAVRYLRAPLDELCPPARSPPALSRALDVLRHDYRRLRVLAGERGAELRAEHGRHEALAALTAPLRD
jgi:glycosyltransferase involved in cell wall biosynthesis